jgi:hypothetical protein
LEADLHACQRDVAQATVISDRMEGHIGELKALEWVMYYKRGCYQLAETRFYDAGVSFKQSMKVYDRGRPGHSIRCKKMISYLFIRYNISTPFTLCPL